MSPIFSNPPKSFCLIQSKSQSPNERPDDALQQHSYASSSLFFWSNSLPLPSPTLLLCHPSNIRALPTQNLCPCSPSWSTHPQTYLNKNRLLRTASHPVCINPLEVHSPPPLFYIFTQTPNLGEAWKISVCHKSHSIFSIHSSPSYTFNLMSFSLNYELSKSRESPAPRTMYLTHTWYLINTGLVSRYYDEGTFT